MYPAHSNMPHFTMLTPDLLRNMENRNRFLGVRCPKHGNEYYCFGGKCCSRLQHPSEKIAKTYKSIRRRILEHGNILKSPTFWVVAM
jgi:ribosomal protein S27E